MPYSPSYLMQQMARGRPLPSGSPDPELHHAVARLSPLDIEAALHKGARADALDPQGRAALHALLDQAGVEQGTLRVPMERLIACCRALLRQGASVMTTHPRTRETVLGRAAHLAAHPQALQWYRFWHDQRKGDWQAPQGPQRQSAWQAWAERASDDVRAALPPVALETKRPRRAP